MSIRWLNKTKALKIRWHKFILFKTLVLIASLKVEIFVIVLFPLEEEVLVIILTEVVVKALNAMIILMHKINFV